MTNDRWMSGLRHFLGHLALLSALLLPLGLVGCSGPTLAPVTGKVTFKGEVIKGGNIIFTPAGKGQETNTQAANAEVQPDGTYSLGTNTKGDGASVGRHRVLFTPPEQKLTEEQRTNPKFNAPPPMYVGLRPVQEEVEVKAGPNTIDIELKK